MNDEQNQNTKRYSYHCAYDAGAEVARPIVVIRELEAEIKIHLEIIEGLRAETARLRQINVWQEEKINELSGEIIALRDEIYEILRISRKRETELKRMEAANIKLKGELDPLAWE